MKTLYTVLAVVCGICFIGLVWWTIDRSNSFDKNVGNWLELAGDANTIEQADKYLSNALEGIKKLGLTSGNTALFFHNPNRDLSEWYNILLRTRDEVTRPLLGQNVESMTELMKIERSNALMKIHEAVLDEDGGVNAPANIVTYPYVLRTTIFFLLSIAGLAVFWGLAAKSW